MSTERFALAAAAVVALGAVIGSAASLYRIAEDAQLALPLALPVALDLLALSAAVAVRAHRHVQLAWLTLAGGVVLSAGLQIADVADQGPVAWLTHGAVPLAALLAFELALPVDAPPVVRRKPRPKPERTPPAAPEVRPTPLRPPRPDATPLRPAASLEDLLPLARTVAAQLEAEGRNLSRRALADGMRAAGRGVGPERAGQLVKLLKDQNGTVELEVVS